jgi:hypothetical protein
VTETSNNNYSAATFSGDCNASGTVSIAAGNVKTCTVTNNDKAPTTITTSTFGTFGTGASANDIPDWDEEGTDSDSSSLAASSTVSGQNAVSPDGGRFALIGEDDWICRAVTTTGFHQLKLNYYWHGDTDAEDGESGSAQYATSGACTTATFTSVGTHELDDADNNVDEGWSTLQSPALPNGVTLIRFIQSTSQPDEEFRVDGVSVTGVAN